MIISVNWLKKFTDIDVSVDDLSTLIGARLVEIEGAESLATKYKDVLIVRVVECGPLEGTDHLNLTKIDDGGVVEGVERDENGLVQVVCGAPNVTAGLLAAWLPPHSIVPETFGDSEPFVLTAKNLRGVISNGMLASAKELDLFEDHAGILEIDKDVEPGTQFVSAYELDDYLLDIENKSLTHRPDTFGIVGFAREVAAIQGKNFITPEWLTKLDPQIDSNNSIEAPTITIDDETLSDRFQAIVLDNVKKGSQSPLLIQTYLGRSGIRPISAVVDVTNYLMLAAGRPLHAYDYDKLLAVGDGTIDIHVRSARKGETLKLIDGKVVELDPEDIVVSNGNTPVGLAGAMGGFDTEIDSSTTRILLECATFNLYKLRNMQMRHGIFTEAITRLTKGLPGALGAPVLAEAVRMMDEFAGATPASPIGDAYPGKHDPISIDIDTTHINDLLGTAFTSDEVKRTLESVEFTVTQTEGLLQITVPYWRQDIHIQEDIIEEVGRLNGFDSIMPTLPNRDFSAVLPDAFDQLRARLRSLLVRAGSNEVLTYSFIHGDVLQHAQQKTEDSYRISNSISPDLQYYRQSLTPSLLQLIHPNVKNGFDEFALFELNKVHPKQRGMSEEAVPDEANALALTVTSRKNKPGAAYYQAKKVLDYVTSSVGLDLTYAAIEHEIPYPTAAPFEYHRSATVIDVASGERLGIIGEYKRSVSKAFKLPEYTAGFELDVDALLRVTQSAGRSYSPLSRFPSTERDVCFQVTSDTTYAQIITATIPALEASNLQSTVTPVDIYQPEDKKTKNITIRIKLIPMDHTMTADEITAVMSDVIDAVIEQTHASVI